VASGRHQLVDGVMLSLCVEDKSAIQSARGPKSASEWGEDVCVYTDI